MIIKFKLYEQTNNFPFSEGDKIVVTRKKSKFYGQTGRISYIELPDDWENDPTWLSIEVKMDYTDQVLLFNNMYDIDKCD